MANLARHDRPALPASPFGDIADMPKGFFVRPRCSWAVADADQDGSEGNDNTHTVHADITGVKEEGRYPRQHRRQPHFDQRRNKDGKGREGEKVLRSEDWRSGKPACISL